MVKVGQIYKSRAGEDIEIVKVCYEGKDLQGRRWLFDEDLKFISAHREEPDVNDLYADSYIQATAKK